MIVDYPIRGVKRGNRNWSSHILSQAIGSVVYVFETVHRGRILCCWNDGIPDDRSSDRKGIFPKITVWLGMVEISLHSSASFIVVAGVRKGYFGGVDAGHDLEGLDGDPPLASVLYGL